ARAATTSAPAASAGAGPPVRCFIHQRPPPATAAIAMKASAPADTDFFCVGMMNSLSPPPAIWAANDDPSPSGSPLRPSGEAFWSMFMLKLSDCWLITSPCLRPMGPRQSGWACDPAGSARAGGGADQGRLEEDAQGHLGLHGAV